MPYVLLAEVTLLVHALFVLFVVLGGVAVLRWRWLARLHLPAAVWGVLIELGGWVCPLTYVENHFRRLGGESGYRGTFIEQYLEPVLYPLGLTQRSQIIFGLTAFLINFVIYVQLWRRNKTVGK
ncbi:MAG: DUF2784 domain-containing protein [Deltaproteobacteria bacterium]|nr:DUF2784 domain-containing protein [Deltaproteobacteria bacterium]